MSELQQRIEAVVEELGSGNRFDKLVAIRDEAQRLLLAERAKEEADTKAEVERLTVLLSSKRARVANLEKVVRNTEKRQRKAKAVAK